MTPACREAGKTEVRRKDFQYMQLLKLLDQLEIDLVTNTLDPQFDPWDPY